MSIFKNYFDGIDTRTNTADECGEIRERASKIKKRRKIASSTLGVTLAVMMTTTVAVSAAGGWDITEIIGRWFKGNTESIMDNLSEVTVLELEENNFGALEITPKGMVTDDNVIVLFMDVTRTNGGVFDQTEYELTDKDGNILYGKDGNAYKEEPYYGFNVIYLKANVSYTACTDDEVYHNKSDYDMAVRQYQVDDGDPKDNKMTIAFCFDKTETNELFEYAKDERSGIKDVKLEDITLHLCNLKDIRDNGEFIDNGVLLKQYEAENIPLIWNAKLSLNTPPVDNKTVTPNSNTTIKVTDAGGMNEYDRSFKVTNISVSKISLSFDLEAPVLDFWNMPVYYDISAIIMKNGDVIELTKELGIVRDMRSLTRHITYTEEDGASTNWEHMSIILKDPVDPNDVAAVRIGDTTFPIE